MTPSTRALLNIALLSGLALAGQTASAQAFDAARIYGAIPDRDGGALGLAVFGGQKYLGAKETRVLPVPVIDYQWSNGFFAGTGNGLGINFSKQANVSYGLRVTADFGRDEDLSANLNGMGDIKIRPEFGGFVNYNLTQSFVLTSSLRYGAGNDRKDMQLDLGAVYSTMLAPQWRIGAGAAITLVNADYMQTNFGVTAAQSARSGHAVYTPGAGLRDVRANLSLTYAIDQRMAVTGALSARALQSDAKDSPLTRKANSLGGGVVYTYLF
ncbi:MipA/OmpV family protein [Roseateles oligotrophus]|uniref:MipA/OmpV family protein n=1 Tax=Roseateles oligotrophus TaxID=1769250 RepID=A0ABT2YGC8_9BURK|nr:MipA/OmpV family protein [Roseateles oligotrophus]MCV2369087.1 MipA/OmpV family protein [Roseateles oligotrophus]